MTDRTVRVLLTAEAKRLLQVVDTSAAAVQRLGGQSAEAGRKASAGLDQIEKSAGRTGSQLQSLGRFAASAFAAISLAAVSRSALQAADDYTALTGRVMLYQQTQSSTNKTMAELFQISQGLRTPFVQVGDLYTRLKASADQLHASDADLVKVTSAVSAALAIMKTPASTASGALLQFGQLMGGPIVQAQEFNSLIDAMPILLQIAAKNIDGAGGSVSRLKQMVNASKVETKDFFEAILKGTDDLVLKAQGMQSTVSQALTRVNNGWVDYIGRENEAQGSTAKLSTLLNELADNMDTVVGAALDIGTVVVAAIAGRAVGATAVAIAGQVRYAISIVNSRREAVLQAQAELEAATATQAHTAALLRQAQAQVGLSAVGKTVATAQAAHAAAEVASAAAAVRVAAATRAAALAVTGFRAVLAAMGGPVGLAVTGLTLLAFWFTRSGNEAEESGKKTTQSIDEIIAKTQELDRVRQGGVALTDDDQADLKSLAGELGRVNTAIALYQQMQAKQPGETAFGAEIDRLTGRAAQLQKTIAAITNPPSIAAPELPGASASAQGEAALARLRANLQALSDVQKASADRQTAALDAELRQNLIGYQEYYTRRGALEASAVQRQVAASAAELAQLAQIRDAVSAEKPANDGARDEQAKKLAQIDAQRVQLQGEINAAKIQEQGINDRTQSQIAAAADAADKRLSDVRSRLAQLSGDAATIAAEARSQLEREYRDALHDPSTSAGDKAAINSLIDRTALQAEFDAVREKADSLVADLRQRWDSLSQSVQAGTKSTAEAQGEFNDQLEATNTPLQEYLQQLQQLAEKLGPDARREVAGLGDEFAGLTQNVRTPLQQLAAEWSDTSSQIQKAGVTAFNNIADSLTNAAVTGKLNFKSLALSIVQDLIRIQIQSLLTAAAMKASGLLGTIIGVAVGAAGGAAGGAGAGAGASGGGSFVPMYAADGGPVVGPGTETSDSVHARLSNGEFVLNAASSKSLGRRTLQLFNKFGARALGMILSAGSAPAYAKGGAVGAASMSGAGISVSRNASVQVNAPITIQGTAGSDVDEDQARNFGKQLQERIRQVTQEEIANAQRPGGALAGARLG